MDHGPVARAAGARDSRCDLLDLRHARREVVPHGHEQVLDARALEPRGFQGLLLGEGHHEPNAQVRHGKNLLPAVLLLRSRGHGQVLRHKGEVPRQYHVAKPGHRDRETLARVLQLLHPRVHGPALGPWRQGRPQMGPAPGPLPFCARLDARGGHVLGDAVAEGAAGHGPRATDDEALRARVCRQGGGLLGPALEIGLQLLGVLEATPVDQRYCPQGEVLGQGSHLVPGKPVTAAPHGEDVKEARQVRVLDTVHGVHVLTVDLQPLDGVRVQLGRQLLHHRKGRVRGRLRVRPRVDLAALDAAVPPVQLLRDHDLHGGEGRAIRELQVVRVHAGGEGEVWGLRVVALARSGRNAGRGGRVGGACGAGLGRLVAVAAREPVTLRHVCLQAGDVEAVPAATAPCLHDGLPEVCAHELATVQEVGLWGAGRGHLLVKLQVQALDWAITEGRLPLKQRLDLCEA
mmetsp:Transcript_14918/g.47016  ORF Transcript_14918/g.47016 Transcript_14918/m.47016 type:complete len:460 (-) Transcript_14918:605-1984(-)